MKIKPEFLLIKKNNIISKKILVTGSDEAYIDFITDFIIKIFREKNYFIDNSLKINKNIVGDLFSDKKVLFVLKNYNSKWDELDDFESENHSILISSQNNKKINSIKQGFLKSKESMLIECYPLNRANKEVIIKDFVEKNNLKLSNDVFWYVVENFDNNYLLLSKQLEALSLFDSSINQIKDVERAVFIENKIEINKLIFHIFKKNKDLIDLFNKNILTQGDFYIFLNSLKLYLKIIVSTANKEDALVKFPKYLFNERDIFLKIYNNIGKAKVLKIYKNIWRIEWLVRKNPSLCLVVGLRFFINIKKIITS